MLESHNWTFVVCFFLSLLNRQDKPSSLIWMVPDPRPRSPKHRINHTGETNIDYCWTDRRNAGLRAQNVLKSSSDIDSFSLSSPTHLLTFHETLALAGKSCPLSLQQQPDPRSVINDLATPFLLHSPHPSFFFLLVPITGSAGFFSAFHLHLSCLKPFNAVNCWGNNGADRWDQSNLQSICMGKMETMASRLLGFPHCVSTLVFKLTASTLLITILFPGMLGCCLKSQ